MSRTTVEHEKKLTDEYDASAMDIRIYRTKLFKEKNTQNIANAKKYEISNVKLTPFARLPSCNRCSIVEQFSAWFFKRKRFERRLRARFYAKMQFSFLLKHSLANRFIFILEKTISHSHSFTMLHFDCSSVSMNERKKIVHKKNIMWM